MMLMLLLVLAIIGDCVGCRRRCFEVIKVSVKGLHPIDEVAAVIIEVDLLPSRNVLVGSESYEIHAAFRVDDLYLAVGHRPAVVVSESHLVPVSKTVHVTLIVHHEQIAYPLRSTGGLGEV